MVGAFTNWLREQDKSTNTIKTYAQHLQEYLDWVHGSFGNSFTKLYRENVLEYKSYLLNIKKLNAKSVNVILAALTKFNEYLVEEKFQAEMVLSKKDYLKVQTEYASPATVSKEDVESFRQKVLNKKVSVTTQLSHYWPIPDADLRGNRFKDV